MGGGREHAPVALRVLSNLQVTVIVIGGVLLASLSAVVALANEGGEHPGLAAFVGSATVAILVAVGLLAWRRDAANRFGALLVLAGIGSFLVSLSASSNDLLYSIGRVSYWMLQPLLIYLFLAYPSGRLPGRPERVVVAAAVALVVLLYLPTALLAEAYPLLPAYCSDACPGNAFAVAAPAPGFVDSVLAPAREVITVGVYLATALLMFGRLRAATPLRRHSLTPVFAAMILRSVVLVVALVTRRAGVSAAALEPLVWISLFTIPLAALGFLLGLLRWRLYSAAVLERLALDLDGPGDPERLRRRFAEALGDPSLRLLYAASGASSGWRDHSGRPVDLPSAAQRCVVEIRNEGEPIAAIVCDPALDDQRSVIEAAGSWLRAVLVRQGLDAALKASLRDVEASRRRLATAAAAERRRIERDLHDGVQQQLVTLRVALELVREQVEGDPEHGVGLLRDLAPRVDSVIEEVRLLARGIYPSLLADAGLAEALRGFAFRGELPVTVRAERAGRYPLEIETAIYFCCLEALQNATKHADASRVWIELEPDKGELHFEVRDDGQGFAPSQCQSGAGLTNMRDRLAAVGGDLVIDSTPGQGTAVRGWAPIQPG